MSEQDRPRENQDKQRRRWEILGSNARSSQSSFSVSSPFFFFCLVNVPSSRRYSVCYLMRRANDLFALASPRAPLRPLVPTQANAVTNQPMGAEPRALSRPFTAAVLISPTTVEMIRTLASAFCFSLFLLVRVFFFWCGGLALQAWETH